MSETTEVLIDYLQSQARQLEPGASREVMFLAVDKLKELTVWRPMSTAPKDGREIIIRATYPDGHIVSWVAKWHTTDLVWDTEARRLRHDNFLTWHPLPSATS